MGWLTGPGDPGDPGDQVIQQLFVKATEGELTFQKNQRPNIGVLFCWD